MVIQGQLLQPAIRFSDQYEVFLVVAFFWVLGGRGGKGGGGGGGRKISEF